MKKYYIVFVIFLSVVYCQEGKSPGDSSGTLVIRDLFDNTSGIEVSCYRIPVIITLLNGDLIAACDERVPSCNDLRSNKDINIIMRRSRDNGETWSDIETVIDYPCGKSASDPSMIVDKQTNEIFMFYNFMDLENEPHIYYQHVIKSTDDGKSWSRPQDITSQITKPEWHDDFQFITSGRGIQTRSGTLLHTLVNLTNGLHVYGSSDHGKTWFFIDTPIKPADESKIVELMNGSWMINSRVNSGGMRYSHTSSDYGATWNTIPEPDLLDPGCNASLIRYSLSLKGHRKNWLLFANTKSADIRKNMTVRMSKDEGQTWTTGKTIYPGSSAYSSLTILQNGEIGLLFERDDYSKISFTHFSLEWLMNMDDGLLKPENE